MTPHNGRFTSISKKPPLKILHPRPDLLDHDIRLGETLLVLAQIPSRRRMYEDVERAWLLPVPKFRNGLNQSRRQHNGEKDSGQADARTTVDSHGRRPKTESK